MSRDKRGKQLAEELGISYGEAMERLWAEQMSARTARVAARISRQSGPHPHSQQWVDVLTRLATGNKPLKWRAVLNGPDAPPVVGVVRNVVCSADRMEIDLDLMMTPAQAARMPPVQPVLVRLHGSMSRRNTDAVHRGGKALRQGRPS